MEDVSRRNCSVRYYLPQEKGNDNVKVCQKNICNIFSITPRRIQILIEKLKDNITVTDKRGLHKNRPRSITDETKLKIREHINSFPRQESHYSRGKTENEYLSANLNLNIMFKLFSEKHPDISISKRVYVHVFQSDFKLKFGIPRSDTCKTCDSYFIKICAEENEQKLRSLQIESERHHMRAEAAYSQLREDQKAAQINQNNVVLFTDLQQVLYCPTLKHSSVFYQRQYSSFNYAVHDGGSGDAYMMLWHECVAQRGANEIASCFLRYITEKYKPLEHGEERKLTVWSDRCVGQNNNWRMVSMYQLLIISKFFTQINQKFLVSGHSFLPCDRDFSLIERKKKTAVVHCPRDWIEVLVSARPSNPFTVIYMDQADFKDFSVVEKGLKKTADLKITEYLWLQLNADDPTSVKVRKQHNILQPWQTFSLNKPQHGKGHRNELPLVLNISQLKPAYNAPLPIKPQKKKDLLDMCQYLPVDKRLFYENLSSGVSPTL